jgi:hypothetical protein
MYSKLAIAAVLVALAISVISPLVRDRSKCAEGRLARVSAKIERVNHFKVRDSSYWIIYLNKGARTECAIEKLSPDHEPPMTCKAGGQIEASGKIYREGWLQVDDLKCT